VELTTPHSKKLIVTKVEQRKDLQVLGIRRWRELVTDRKKWRDIVRQAKAHSGLCANGEKEDPPPF
jgi:hypothetical protein